MQHAVQPGQFRKLQLELSQMSFQKRVKDDDAWDMYFNRKYELCVGKKNQFPKSLMSFRRIRKKASQYKKEKEDAKKLKLPAGFQPTKYFYRILTKKSRVSLGTKESYPYDW